MSLAIEEPISLGEDSVSEIMRGLGQVFQDGFRIVAPTKRNPHYMVHHLDSVVAAIRRVGPLHVQQGLDWLCLEGEGQGQLVSSEQALTEIQQSVCALTRIPPERVVPILWMAQAVPDRDLDPTQGVIVAQAGWSLAEALLDRLVKIGRSVTPSPSPEVSTAFAVEATMEATAQYRRHSPKMDRLLNTLFHSITTHARIGNLPIRFGARFVQVEDLVTTDNLLPAILMCAWEDWQNAASRGTNGTGFTVHLSVDPNAMLGYAVTDVQPAIPWVVMAPFLAVLSRCEKDDHLDIGMLVSQFHRYMVKHNREGVVLVSF